MFGQERDAHFYVHSPSTLYAGLRYILTKLTSQSRYVSGSRVLKIRLGRVIWVVPVLKDGRWKIRVVMTIGPPIHVTCSCGAFGDDWDFRHIVRIDGLIRAGQYDGALPAQP